MEETIPQAERNGAMFAHFSGLLAMIGMAFIHVVGPLVFYLMARDNKTPFALEHAREALNFQITASIVWFFAIVGYVVFIVVGTLADGRPTIPSIMLGIACILVGLLYGIFDLVCVIVAGIAASNGRPFRYPLSIRFVR